MGNKKLLFSLELLAKIDDYLSESIELNFVLPKIIDEIKSYLKCEQVFIFSNHLEGKEEFIIDKSFNINLDDFKLLLQKHLNEEDKIEKLKENKYYSNYNSTVIYDNNRDNNIIPTIKSELIFPIFIKTPEISGIVLQDFWGLLSIYDYQSDRIWKKEEIDTIKLIIKKIVLAVERSLIYQELQLKNKQLEEGILFDSLTQLPNYESFIDCLEFEWFRLLRQKDYLSVILISINGANTEEKSIIFPQIATCLLEIVKRSSDLCARYSDNEFVVVLPHTHEQGAHILMNKIDNYIKEKIINYDNLILNTRAFTAIPSSDKNYNIFLNFIENSVQKIKS